MQHWLGEAHVSSSHLHTGPSLEEVTERLARLRDNAPWAAKQTFTPSIPMRMPQPQPQPQPIKQEPASSFGLPESMPPVQHPHIPAFADHNPFAPGADIKPVMPPMSALGQNTPQSYADNVVFIRSSDSRLFVLQRYAR